MLTLAIFSSLTSVGFLLDKRVWADAEAFAQTNITMQHLVSSEYTKNLNHVIEYCRDNQSGGAFIFVNTKSLSHKLLPLLETKLAENDIAVDVVHVHGSLAKEEKLNLIKLLMKTMTVGDYNPNILLASRLHHLRTYSFCGPSGLFQKDVCSLAHLTGYVDSGQLENCSCRT